MPFALLRCKILAHQLVLFVIVSIMDFPAVTNPRFKLRDDRSNGFKSRCLKICRKYLKCSFRCALFEGSMRLSAACRHSGTFRRRWRPLTKAKCTLYSASDSPDYSQSGYSIPVNASFDLYMISTLMFSILHQSTNQT